MGGAGVTDVRVRMFYHHYYFLNSSRGPGEMRGENKIFFLHLLKWCKTRPLTT